ncbi:hypothetical protein FNV43_RR13056 [Rhamnella rubrinervis]|uniref:Uncharacterized protein n=1 Tax=Rhamnella rubrinervis TaxID=2594499 RepID=A0A8K0MDJ0_9ROSA|nr:hypothetical protein FNV43_RR13056 [Rhamnella rubrinervis]
MGSLRHSTGKTREDDSSHMEEEPHATRRDDNLLELFKEFAETITRRFPRDAAAKQTVDSEQAQESIYLSTKHRTHIKASEEEPFDRKEPRQRDRRHPRKRMNARSTKPQEDLWDYLNRKAASRNLHQKTSTSYHSPPKEQEDLTGILRTRIAEQPEAERQATLALRISKPDVGLMKEELRHQILSDLFKERAKEEMTNDMQLAHSVRTSWQHHSYHNSKCLIFPVTMDMEIQSTMSTCSKSG